MARDKSVWGYTWKIRHMTKIKTTTATPTQGEAPILWATWCKELTHWKTWVRLKAGEEGDDRGWDGWMATPTRWTWVWASSRSWWQIGKPGMVQSMGSQRVGHNWATELNWSELRLILSWSKHFWEAYCIIWLRKRRN